MLQARTVAWVLHSAYPASLALGVQPMHRSAHSVLLGNLLPTEQHPAQAVLLELSAQRMQRAARRVELGTTLLMVLHARLVTRARTALAPLQIAHFVCLAILLPPRLLCALLAPMAHTASVQPRRAQDVRLAFTPTTTRCHASLAMLATSARLSIHPLAAPALRGRTAWATRRGARTAVRGPLRRRTWRFRAAAV